MKKHAFRIGLVVTMLLGLMMISANAACPDTCVNPHPTGAGHTTGTWAPLGDQTAAYTLPAGHYYLDDTDGNDKVTFAGRITIEGEVYICLNGKTLDFTKASGSTLTDGFRLAYEDVDGVRIYGKLHICDCTDNPGKVISSHTSGSRHLVSTSTGATQFHLWNGTLDSTNTNTSVDSTYKASTVYAAAGLNVNIHGGKIIGNSKGAAGIYVHHTGTVNVHGGTITGAKPAVYFRIQNTDATATFNAIGGTLENTTGGNVVGFYSIAKKVNFNISGDPVFKGVFSVGAKCLVNGEITGGTFSNDVSAYCKAGYELIDNKNDTWTVSKIAGGENIHNDGTSWFKLDNETVIKEGYNYYLAGDLTLEKTLEIAANNVTICLHDHTLSSTVVTPADATAATNVIDVAAGCNVTIQDCDSDDDDNDVCEGKITGAASARAIRVNGNLEMTGGTISGFKPTYTKVTETDGVPTSEVLVASGGAVYVAEGGTFTMSGGTITNNEGANGGGIYSIGTFTQSGGTISMNKATSYGGGVYVYRGVTFDMSGGTIHQNTATYGGGVYLADADSTSKKSGGVLNLSGTAAITGNTANLGGGVYLGKFATKTYVGPRLNMTNGTISGNTANYGGGGVAISCNYVGDAHNYLSYHATMNMSGGKITANKALDKSSSDNNNGGGGIWVSRGIVKLSGTAEVSNNTTTTYGGGIRGRLTCDVTVDGEATITGNTADERGGAIEGHTNARIYIKDGVISGNKCPGRGSAVYIHSNSSVEVSGGHIHGNKRPAVDKDDTTYGPFYIKGAGAEFKMTGGFVGLKEDGTADPNVKFYDASNESAYSQCGFLSLWDGAMGTVSGGYIYNRYTASNGLDPYFSCDTADGSDVTVSGGYFGRSSSNLKGKMAPETVLYSVTTDNKNIKYAVAKPFTATAEVDLTDSLNLNIYIKKSDVPGKVSSYTTTFNGSEVTDWPTVTKNGEEYYCFTKSDVAAKDMAETASLTIVNGENTIVNISPSIKSYAQTVLTGNYNDELKIAVSDMLLYGAAAQAYFETGATPVTDGVTLVAGSEVDLTGKENPLHDVTFYKGSSLSLKDSIILNLHFAEDIETIEVTGANGITVETNGKTAIVKGIKLPEAGNALSIKVNNHEVFTDSIEAYAARANNLRETGEDAEKLAELCQAMMNFVASAKDYFQSQSL